VDILCDQMMQKLVAFESLLGGLLPAETC
jgi:hypothetical protein